MVSERTLKVLLVKFLDLGLYIMLVFASTFFMVDCMSKYMNKSTYFEVTNKKQNSIELPTFTLCFEPNYKESGLSNYNMSLFPQFLPEKSNFTMQEIFEESTYQIGEDFLMTIESFNQFENQIQLIKKLGKVENSGQSIIDYEIKDINSQKHGKCFKMILKPLQDILFSYLILRVEMNKTVSSKPEKLKVCYLQLTQYNISIQSFHNQ